MKNRRLLIVDSNEDFQQELYEALRGDYSIKCCCDGKEALSQLLALHPDILILDLMIPSLDGLSLLQAAFSAGIIPTVITVSRFYNDYMLSTLTRMNVGYIMLKPCDVAAVVNRVHDLDQELVQHIPIPPDPWGLASEILLSLGFVTKHRGYAYLREAILFYAADPQQSITKELYPAVAVAFNCLHSNVERSIRTAIESAWNRGDPAVWDRYFPRAPGMPATRPTNSTVLTRLSAEIRSLR